MKYPQIPRTGYGNSWKPLEAYEAFMGASGNILEHSCRAIIGYWAEKTKVLGKVVELLLITFQAPEQSNFELTIAG